MAELKTKVNNKSVHKFISGIQDPQKRQDSHALAQMMKQLTKEEPKMWGDSIVGFGSYHYKYASGREGDMPITAFSPRKQNLTLYLMPGFDRHADLLARLGKHSTGKVCLYIKKLDDVDMNTLRELVKLSMEDLKKRDK